MLRTPALDHVTAMRLAATEYQRLIQQLRELDEADWTKPTSCPEWDVRAMATHALGMADMVRTPWETRRQLKEAGKGSGMFVDNLTALQVREREQLQPNEIIERLERAAKPAVRGRRRVPALLRLRRIRPEQTDGVEPWTLGYLIDVVFTRDPWMHRTDIAEATGKTLELTADHDGVLVDDVVREWAARHAKPCALVLTGPAGGSWRFGAGGPELEMDAVEFCRTVGGRAAGEGLLATAVPF